MGTDEFGNRYYRSKQRTRWGREQRWCMFKGANEPSKVPPEWHAWLHYTVDKMPDPQNSMIQPWQEVHQPNRTGTDGAYRPSGHTLEGGRRAAATGDYEPWQPS